MRDTMGIRGVAIVLSALLAGRAAAVTPVPHGAHMDDDPVIGMLAFERLEWQDRDGGDGLAWDLGGWLGGDFSRLWLHAEGEREAGRTVDNEMELFYGKPLAPWWDLRMGVRHATLPGESRNQFAVGVIGTAPQRLHVRATAYAGDRRQFGVIAEVDYEVLLTNWWILTPRVEGTWWRRDDAEAGIGSGLNSLTAGLRLRWEPHRKFARRVCPLRYFCL